jgi:hypothetical protein
LRTPTGSKFIEEFAIGDLVLSRDEHDPLGLVVAQRVEEVFVREGLIWELRLGGQVIRTTAEHPFYHETRGWLACHHLHVGDKLLCEDGSFMVLEGIRDTGDWETVYNLRIANFHTYFVGCDEWGFAVWAHNEYTGNRTRESVEAALRKLGVPGEEAFYLAEMGARKGVDGNKWIGEFEGIARGLHQEDVVKAARTLMQESHGSMAWRHPLRGGEFGTAPGSPPRIVDGVNIDTFDFGHHLEQTLGVRIPLGMPDPHAHHILFKWGNGHDQHVLVLEGQVILREAGINPILGIENLAWAPNRVAGQHDIAALRQVVNTLRQVKNAGGDYTDFRMALEQLGQVAAQRR